MRKNLGGLLIAVALGACSSSTTNNTILVVADDASTDASAVGEDAASDASETDGGPTDAGLDGPAAADPFAGAPAFAGCQPPSLDSTNHQGASPMAGSDCLSCHAKGSAQANRHFMFAGTIYKANGTPLEGAEIRLRDPDTEMLWGACSDVHGNFSLSPAQDIPANVAVGARNATGARQHATVIANGNCNASGCHGPGNRITL